MSAEDTSVDDIVVNACTHLDGLTLTGGGAP